jgi:hypothetical protein
MSVSATNAMLSLPSALKPTNAILPGLSAKVDFSKKINICELRASQGAVFRRDRWFVKVHPDEPIAESKQKLTTNFSS